jgi:hypothetical protein
MSSQWNISAVPAGLRRLASAFVGQEDVGLLGALLHRLARFLGGDPTGPCVVTSTGTGNPVGLPDNTPASGAVLHVTGNPIAYTLDGTVPVAATSAQLPVGAVIHLTGQPTLKAFQFCSTVAANGGVTGYFYD